MKKIKYTISALTLAATLSSSNIYADTIAIGPKIGLQGIGLDARLGITEKIFARIGGNYFQYSHKFNDGEINLKAKVKLMTIPVMVDFHPFDDSGFKVSLGAAYNGNKLTATGKSAQNVSLGNGRVYTPSQIGNVDAKLVLGNSLAGIISLGYDSSLISKKAFSFNFEAGVMYAGKAKLKISSSSQLPGPFKQILLEDLKRDADKSLDKIQKYLKFFPILSVGVRYSF